MFKKTRAVKIKEKSVGPAEIAISSVALQKMWHSVAKKPQEIIITERNQNISHILINYLGHAWTTNTKRRQK